VVDILFPAYKRPEFTAAAAEAIARNTPQGAYRLVIYEDWSANPVDIMKDFLARDGSEIFAKIDNDTIVSPGWWGGLAVMETHPELGLLGIEPPASRTAAPWAHGKRPAAPELEECYRHGIPGYVPCESIGGIGFMRRSAFAGREPMRAHSGYGGFQDWQMANPDVARGWIRPPLQVFLLDRLPIEPWASLSREYIARGWQRSWTNYDPADSALWNWWLKA
jgi:hypothetical protein